jgi:glycosyltransferase involved in cell wall biosynthesis
MKILIIHTYYKIRGGEDVVFEQEVQLLSKYNEVETLVFHNQTGFKGLFQFLFSIWNIGSAKKLNRKIKNFNPDIIHIHNWHFAASPTVFIAARCKNIPVIHTLHNYRLLCPSAILLHNGKIFEDSLYQKFPWKAIKKKVYRNSYLQTFWLAFIVWFHKRIGTWKQVDKYIVLTEFSKQLYSRSSLGISEDRFIVKPNFIENIESGAEERENFYLYVGRLSEEKGINALLETFTKTNFQLKIAGDGPLLQKVISVSDQVANVEYLGKLDKQEVLEYMKKCTALLFPSIWYEGMPMTIIEAFAMKSVIICSNLGAMSAMIVDEYNGLFFKTGDSASLLDKIKEWESKSEQDKESMRNNAYNTYKENYTSDINLKQLSYIYNSLIEPNK